MFVIPKCKAPDGKHTWNWVNYPLSKQLTCTLCGIMNDYIDVEMEE